MDTGRGWVDQPLYMLEVPSGCCSLALRPTIDMGNQVQTTTKSSENIIIAWLVDVLPACKQTNAFN